VLLVGHAGFYPRFGFRRASCWGLRMPIDVPDEAFMALELVPGTLDGCAGTVRFRPEFDNV
jgi:predicted N-acetyltransferase YhbS